MSDENIVEIIVSNLKEIGKRIEALEKELETYSHFIDEHQMVLDNQERLSGEIVELKDDFGVINRNLETFIHGYQTNTEVLRELIECILKEGAFKLAQEVHELLAKLDLKPPEPIFHADGKGKGWYEPREDDWDQNSFILVKREDLQFLYYWASIYFKGQKLKKFERIKEVYGIE